MEMVGPFPLNKLYKSTLLFLGGLQLGVSPGAVSLGEGRILRLFQRGLRSHHRSRNCRFLAARGHGASRGLSPPLQSVHPALQCY